jgi:two-component system phosphate regulon response regulator PhoB
MPTVLVVDDELDVIDLLRYKLRRAGFDVLVATTGWGGLQLIRSERPDLVILDLMLPEMSGYEICRQLKASPDTANIPILMLTAKSEDDDRYLGFEVGADDYVTKPFSPRELLYRVTALLRRSQGPVGPETLSFDGFKIDRSSMRVWLNGNKLDLTSTEFKLLVLLIQRRGRVQERDTLLSEVWDYQTGVDTRTVDTHMRRLREKLGDQASRIETVRGKGYRFRSSGTNDAPPISSVPEQSA